MTSVYIPVQGTEEEVQVALDQLPHDASDILDILKAEQAPLHLWLIIAVRFPSPSILVLYHNPKESPMFLAIVRICAFFFFAVGMRYRVVVYPCLRET